MQSFWKCDPFWKKVSSASDQVPRRIPLKTFFIKELKDLFFSLTLGELMVLCYCLLSWETSTNILHLFPYFKIFPKSLWYPNLAHRVHPREDRHFSLWIHNKWSERTMLAITPHPWVHRSLLSEGYPDTREEQERKGRKTLPNRTRPPLVYRSWPCVNLTG